jgi:hypothetical protein
MAAAAICNNHAGAHPGRARRIAAGPAPDDYGRGGGAGTGVALSRRSASPSAWISAP